MLLFAKIAHHILTTGIESFSQQRQCCYITWDVGLLMVCVSCVLGAWQFNTKPRDKPFLLSCWYVLKLRERPSYPRWLQKMNPGSIILNLRQKVNVWNDTILHLHGRINSLSMGKVVISRLGLWRIDSCGCDAERGDSQLVMLTEVSKHFKQVQPYKNSTEILLEHDFCQVAHKFEDWEPVTVFVWTLYPHPPNCSNLAPLDFRLFGALKYALLGRKFETD
jgi:hypothetical protein